MSSLGDLELHEALEREARDDRCLRRQIGVPLDMELELTLPQLKRIALHTREEHLLVADVVTEQQDETKANTERIRIGTGVVDPVGDLLSRSR